MKHFLIVSWLFGLCGAAAGCMADADPADDVGVDRKGGIVCVAYPCCGDGVCDEAETCLLCPQDCACQAGEICVADSSASTPGDPGADAVCVADGDPYIKVKMQPERIE